MGVAATLSLKAGRPSSNFTPAQLCLLVVFREHSVTDSTDRPPLRRLSVRATRRAWDDAYRYLAASIVVAADLLLNSRSWRRFSAANCNNMFNSTPFALLIPPDEAVQAQIVRQTSYDGQNEPQSKRIAETELELPF
jgi:hypothetical protein